MHEWEVEFLQLDGLDALAGEEQGIGHFAEEKSKGEGWGGEERGAVQGRGEDSGELGVGHRLRGDDV